MNLKLDYNFVMKEFVGDIGITKEDIDAYAERLKDAQKKVFEKRANGTLGFMDLAFQKESLEDIKALGEELRNEFEYFVVVGIGGSALGNKMLNQSINGVFHNDLTKEERNGAPKIYVLENVDPETMDGLLKVVDPEKTVFNVITKSGSTAETMANFMITYNFLQGRVSDDIGRHIVATTDLEKGTLRQIVNDLNLRSLEVPGNVGGRFSVLTAVGLLSAAVSGIDIEKLIAGAAAMFKRCESDSPYENPAMMDAIIHMMMMDKGLNISVMMPYADSLEYLSHWYAQLWAESLGKRYDNDGNEVFTGQTPVKAVGTIDQHSQIQLYTEGPVDKITTFLRVESFRKEVEIPAVFSEFDSVNYLSGQTLNKLMNAEEISTELALVKAKRPNMTIEFPEINEYTIGQFIMMQEMKTAYSGELLNIDAFDQPGVEEGKNATYGLMGRPGYDDKKQEIEKMLEGRKAAYVL